MGWRDVPIKDLKSYCRNWRTKKDIQTKFNLTDSEARHCSEWLRKLTDSVEVRESMKTKRRSYEFRFIARKRNKNV